MHHASLEMQKEMCDEGMALVNAAVEMQNAGDQEGAERNFIKAVELMERALALTYASAEETEAASRLNNKMTRYIKMIKSQRAKTGMINKRATVKFNIIEMEVMPARYRSIAQLFASSQAYGDIFNTMQQTFGFQDSNANNQKEHLMLLLANFKEYVDESNVKDAAVAKSEHVDMEYLQKAIDKFHIRLFNNYTKWCKYVSQKPKFTKEPLADLVLFFLIWGEAGNFRQTPELLCFLFHNLAPSVTGPGTSSQEPGYFLSKIIRPMYNEVKKDNDKKTPMGIRAPHTEIRNYDDFNEFFWTKKCLKYDAITITEAFASVNKSGNPNVVKKTFMERRSWLRALLSFRRIFVSHFVLFIAVLAFAVNMILVCPESPIMYGEDLGTTLQFFGHLYYKPKPVYASNDDATMEFVNGGCNIPKLATCLGVPNYNPGVTFQYLPEDFKMILTDVPFTNCLGLLSGRCSCYLDLLSTCFTQTGTGILVDTDTAGNRKSKSVNYDQSKCMPKWKSAALNVINTNGDGKLNCQACRLEPLYLMNSLPKLIPQFIDFGRSDKGPMIMLGGAACVALLIVWETQNRLFSSVGIGFVGRSMPVPARGYCRYLCFWILLFFCKLMFDYQFMVKSLVETTLFIWLSDPKQYLPVSQFMIQISYHNVIYLFFLWMPALIVFLYDAQIFYAILSVIFGSIRGFTLRIGELRSFRILRLTFKSIPKVFNKKIVANLIETEIKKKKKKKDDNTIEAPERHFLPISYDDGSKPLTVKAQAYSSLLECHDNSDNYTEMSTPHDSDASPHSSRGSINSDSVAGVTGAEFERTIPFAMAWNRCLQSMRDEDVLSNRELSVLSYLIDSKATADRRLYAPVFLTAGKLDESLDIVTECYAVYDQLKSDKKKEKSMQKMEASMTDRLKKDDLRVQAILGSYKFTSQIIKLLLGEEHRELDGCFNFIEEMVFQHQTFKGLNLACVHSCRTSCAELMKTILDVPVGANEANIKFQRCLYSVIDAMELVINVMKKLLSKQENFVKILSDTPLKPNSFFYPGDGQHYASVQLLKIVNDQTAMDIVSRAYQLLTVDNVDAEPRSPEGQRRLRFFANSLFMEMPEARPVRQMHSFSISTPYFNEIVMYSIKELTTENDDSIKLLYYLQTINPFEWENFLERISCKDMNEALKKYPEEVQLWSSYRGQTLARTVRGMMYNEDAIRFLHWLEIGQNEPMHLRACACNACIQLNEMVALKFSYVCTCQIYGKQKDEQKQQAHDIEFLMMKHPGLRVAYVDGPKKMKEGPPKYFSCLVRAQGDKIVEVYRVELPGDPILGEGKPENQNHAIIFTRGEWLQCIDMNQDGYLEECLKMPNLLATVDRKAHEKNPLTIIGFREYVFTGGVSNLASFMQIQELSFVSLGQRMLALFHVRQHYGHPDIFDKMFAMTTGGTAKSSRGINLSEDIFAGFNTTLRGGRVSHEEFIQVGKGRDVGMQQLALFEAKLSSGAGECVISRDAMRMANRLDYFRLNSWFYGNLGWYFTQTMTVYGVYFFIYGKIYFALSGLDAFYLQTGGMGISGVLNTSWALQFGFLLVVPVIAVIGVEQGFRHGITYVLWNCMTLGPIFFTFQMGNRMNYFDRTLIHGGAKYRATGRGFTIKHEKFAELFRFYAFSHFYRGVELAFLLVLYRIFGTFSWCNCSWMMDLTYYNNIQPLAHEWTARCYANYYQSCVLPTNQNYGIMSYSLWLIAATWMWAPFFFNPSGLDWDKVIDDYNDWQHWLQTKNDSSESWLGWWTNELEYLEHSTPYSRFVQSVRKTRFFFVAVGLYLQLMYNLFYKNNNKVVATDIKKDGFLAVYQPYMILGALLVVVLLLVCCGYISNRITKKMTLKQKRLRKLKFNLSFLLLILIVVSMLYLSVGNIIQFLVIILIFAYWVLQINMARLRYNHIIIRTLASGFDRAVGWIVFGPILFIAMFMPFISDFQQRVMFNSAFTSGLEVSKLFSNDAVNLPPAPSKAKPSKKKKRDE
ncbi:callose synthase [Thraustotheca clavata]|uniref:1,3-beta-glucan synthase n=1 Tax=Thraustotheca clavata TaxID=74557 RepID=A0A1W0A7V8_9STRA|nr:callose synthase [Thraustotheca clavata]